MRMPKISIVIPVYNERQNILPSVENIIQAFGSLAQECEILFVDDKSPDGTAQEVERIGQIITQIAVKLVQHGKKEGIGAAHHAGYRAAQGEYVMCLDADLSQSPADLLRMKNMIDLGFDLVIGSRYMSEGKQIGKSIMRDIGSKGMNGLVRFFLGVPLADSTHTFRVFRKKVFEEICSRLSEKGHPSFQIQFSFWAIRSGFRVCEIPVKFVERESNRGKSKISIRRELPPFFKLLFRLLIVRLSLRKCQALNGST